MNAKLTNATTKTQQPKITRRLGGTGGTANYGQDADGCWYTLSFRGWVRTDQNHRATRFYRQQALRARYGIKRWGAIDAKIAVAARPYDAEDAAGAAYRAEMECSR